MSCTKLDYWQGRPISATAYRDIRLPEHPLASKGGIVREHRVVLFAKIGPGTHPCHWCGSPVTWRAPGEPGTITGQGVLIADHLDDDKRNNDPGNLVPSCNRCNVWRHPPQPPIVAGELFLTNPNGSRSRAVERICEFCGEAFLARTTLVRRGGGRFCSTSCAGRR